MNTKLIYLHFLALRIKSPKFWLHGNIQFNGDNRQTYLSSLPVLIYLRYYLCNKTLSKVRNLQINTGRL